MMPASTSSVGWRRLVVAAAALALFDQAAAALVFGTAAVVPGFDPRWARTAAFGVAYVAANALALVAAYQIAFTGRRPDLGRFGPAATRRVPSSVAAFIGWML